MFQTISVVTFTRQHGQSATGLFAACFSNGVTFSRRGETSAGLETANCSAILHELPELAPTIHVVHPPGNYDSRQKYCTTTTAVLLLTLEVPAADADDAVEPCPRYRGDGVRLLQVSV
jgi:hypothetical protein